MNVDKVVQYWTESAAEDWPVAKQLFDNGADRYALFFGHLYLEKLLKGELATRRRKNVVQASAVFRSVWNLCDYSRGSPSARCRERSWSR